MFDTLHTEGQRQFMEALGTVADALRKPQVERIEGLSPSIAIGQHLAHRNPRSTVGTATEVYTYLRVLYARVGHRPCPRCGADIPPPFDQRDEAMVEETIAEEVAEPGEDAGAFDACPCCAARIEQLSMGSFSFNAPAGACTTTGIGPVRQTWRSLELDAVVSK